MIEPASAPSPFIPYANCPMQKNCMAAAWCFAGWYGRGVYPPQPLPCRPTGSDEQGKRPAFDGRDTGDIMTPTVGRMVHFYPGPQDGISHSPGHPLAATIAHVWTDTMVNLGVLDSNGVPHKFTSVELLPPGQPVPEGMGRHCVWPSMVIRPTEPPADAAPLDSVRQNSDEPAQAPRPA